MKINTSLIILISTFSLLTVTHAQIYKWKDASGQVHYTETPPVSGTKTEEMADRVKIAAQYLSNNHQSPQNSATHNQLPEQHMPEGEGAAESTYSEQQKKTAESNTDTAQKQEYCNKQTKILTTLNNNTHIQWRENNETITLSPTQRLEKINSIQQNIQTKCNS